MNYKKIPKRGKHEIQNVMKAKCPNCGSEKINQFRMPTGKIWCMDCNLISKNKERWNPFYPLKAYDFPTYDTIIDMLNNDPDIYPSTWNYKDFYNKIKELFLKEIK